MRGGGKSEVQGQKNVLVLLLNVLFENHVFVSNVPFFRKIKIFFVVVRDR